MTAVAIEHRETILQSVMDGKYLADIAAEHGVTSGAISQILSNDPEYKLARLHAAGIRLDRAHKLVEDVAGKSDATGDDLNLARVREIYARRVEYRAAIEFPEVYGPKQQIMVQLDLGSALQEISEALQGRAIEHDASQHETVEPAQLSHNDQNETVK